MSIGMTETQPCEQQELNENTDNTDTKEKTTVSPTNKETIEKYQQKILNGEIEILNSNTAEQSAERLAEKILQMEELLLNKPS